MGRYFGVNEASGHGEARIEVTRSAPLESQSLPVQQSPTRTLVMAVDKERSQRRSPLSLTKSTIESLGEIVQLAAHTNLRRWSLEGVQKMGGPRGKFDPALAMSSSSSIWLLEYVPEAWEEFRDDCVERGTE